MSRYTDYMQSMKDKLGYERKTIKSVYIPTAEEKAQINKRNMGLGGADNALTGGLLGTGALYGQLKNEKENERNNYLANLDTDSERWWVMSAEDAIKEMEDLEYDMNFSMSLYSPEDQERMKARYAGLQSIYGDNAEAVREAWKTRSADLDEAVEFQNGLRQNERIQGWQDKYAGMSYYDLNEAIGKVTDPTEKAWLEQYAPTQMTEQDYSIALGDINTELYKLEKLAESLADDPLNQEAGRLQEMGLESAADVNNRIEELKRQKWQLEHGRDYAGLSQNEDYELMSSFTNSGGGRNFRGVNDSQNFLDVIGRAAVGAYYAPEYDRMTEEEVNNFNYLYQTQGKEAADEYMEYLKPQLDARTSEAFAQGLSEFTSKNLGTAILGNAASVPMNLIGGIGVLDVGAQHLMQDITGNYKPINYNTPGMMPTRGTEAVRGTTAGMITDATGTIQLDEKKHPVLSTILNGRGLADVYQLGMSAIDSRVAALTGNPAVATALLSSSAATSGVLDALERGATDEQALSMGLWNGAFEALFEYIEVDNLLKGDPNWIKAVTNQAITEGLGEGFTSVANNIADGIIMADKSALMQAAAEYESQGLSEREAYRKAFADMMVDIGWDIVGGAASGGLSAGGYSAVGAITSRMQYNALPQQIKTSTERLQSLGMDRNTALDASGQLYKLGQKYEGQRDAFMAAYDPKQDVYRYANDFNTAWEIGRNNGNREYIGKLGLSESQGKIAYELGVAAAKARSEAATVSPEAKKSGYSVSEGGETVSADTGRKITIKGFASVGSDATLDIGGGKTIKAEDVSYADIDEAMLYETVAEVAGSTGNANNILKDYRKAAESGMSASDYAAALRQTYDLGVSGQVAERQLGSYELAGKLGVGVRSIIFSQGRKRGDYKATAKQAVTQARGRQAKRNRQGTFHFERNGRTFSKTQDASLGALESLSKALGVDIYIYESYEDGGKRVYQDRSGKVKSAPNGWYDTETGAIHIDLNAGNFGQGTMMFTAAHELTHFIKDWSPVKFRKLADLLIDRYAEQGVSVRDLIDNQIAKAEKNGRTIDRDTAFEEVVADSMEVMLTQGDAASFMAELKQQDKTLWEKVRDWFKNLAEKLRSVVDAYQGYTPDSPEGRIVAQMEDFIGVLQEAYSEALMDASENYRANEGKKNTTLEGGVKYSFASQVDSVKSNTHDPNNHLNMGSVPLSLSRILSIPRLPMLITPNHVYSISVSVNQAKTENRYRKGVNYHDLGWTVTKKLPNLVGKPEMIIKSNTDVADAAFVVVTSETDKNGDPVIVAFKSDGHGNYFNLDFPTVAVLSGYGKHNFQNYLAKAKTENRILFVNKKSQKKQNTTGVQFSDNIRSSDYTKNLSQFQAIVNSKYKGTAFEKTPILLSDRNNATYAEIEEERRALYQRENELNQRKREAENNPDLLKAMSDYHDLFTEMKGLLPKRRSGTATQEELARIEEIKALREEYLQKVADLQESLGLNAMSQEAAEIRETKEALRIASDEAWAREGAERENKAIEKAGLTAPEYFRKKALKAFKTTTNYNEAGYMLPDGKMLNFSGGERNHRYRDHREIGEIYEATNGAAALNRFLSDGNIRIMAESPGIDIASGVEPTKEQYAAIKRFVNANGVKDRKFFVDFSHADGRRAGNYSYEGAVNADRVVNDIKYYYENGKVREQSSIAQFRWSDRDPTAAATAQELEKQNAKLRQDVKDLRELLSLQGKLTKGTEFRKSSIEAAVKGLAQTAGATLDADGRAQLYDMLKGFYRYIASDENLAWDGVREEAGKIADFLQSNVKFKPQRSDYANDVLGYLRGQRVALSESQRAEVEKLYGYENYRRQLFGAGIYLSKDGISLDSLWHEAAGGDMFPGTFDMDISEGNQPAELLRVIDGMREDDGSGALEYAYNRDFIRQDLIQAVYDSYWRVDNLHTVADRKRREINEIRRKHNERMDALTASHQQTVNRLKEERRADIQAVREAYRERNARDLQKARERYAQARERGRESRAAASQREIVEKAARDIMNMLSKPTKDAHVPMALQKPLEKLLNSIDFTSNRAAAGGEPTIRDVAYTRALQDVKLAIAAQRTALEGDGDGTFSLDVPKEFLDQIDAHIKMIQDATEGLDLTTNRVHEMSSDELRDLAYILKTINRAVRQIDKLHMEGAKARVSDLAKDTVWEMGRRKPVKTEDGGAAMWANYTPTFAFERMGGAATQILDGLKMGQAKLARTSDSIIKFAGETYNSKEVKDWEQDIHEIKLESGKTVKMTSAQIMSFYCLSRREQAKGHLNGGGIRMGNIGEGRKEVIQRDHYKLTQNDIARINGMLTDRQREVANKLQGYMADVGGKLGNEISMARWDYIEMTDKDYFPIRSDSDIHDARNPDQDKANLWGLLNKSFTKAVVKGANDAMIVSSIFDVFANHMSEMAEYNAFALPLVDAMKWYNYRETQKGEGDQITTVGVKKALNDTLGTAAGKYFIDLMTDINSSQKAGRFENFFGKLLSRSKGASVGWNLRVAIQQPTAILRASVYLDPRNLLRGVSKFGSKKLGEEMRKYSGIALWKSLGYYDLNISRGVTDQIKGDTTLLDKMNDWGMWLPGKMDQWTWTSIWAGCKAQVQAEKDLTGEALLRETAKVFDDLVYHTQVADSVLTRSSIMRSKSQTIKELTSFMAEPTMSANLLLSAFQDYREGVTRGEKAKRAMRIAFCGYVLSGLANALITAFADAARDDDEYEGYWEKYFQALFGEKVYDGNLFAELNPLEKIVFVRDILSMLQGYEASKNPFMELVESSVGLLKNVGKFIQGKGSLTAYGLIYQGLQVLGSFTGAAPANMLREVTTIWNNTFGKWNNMIIHRYETDPKQAIRNAYKAGALGKREAQDALIDQGVTVTDAYWMVKEWETGNTSKYTDLYTAALNGQDLTDHIRELTENGKTKKQVLGELRGKIKEWYTDPESDTKITREQAQELVDRYLEMEPGDAEKLVEEWAFELEHGYSYDDIKWTYLDDEITAQEAKDVLIDRMGKTDAEADRRIQYWDFLRNNRDSVLTEYQVADFYEFAEPAGISAEVYERYIVGTKGIESEGTKARKMAVIDSLPLTDAQKDALYFAEGWAKSTLHEAPWR